MSKQKVHGTETENDVTENPIEQSELEGISTTEEKTVIDEEKPAEKAVDEKKSEDVKEEKTVTQVAKSSKKMGVYKFLSLYPQDIYIETLLKYYYPHSFFTKEEWFQKIDDVKKTPVNN